MKFLILSVFLSWSFSYCEAQQIVLLEDGSEIKLLVKSISKAEIGGEIGFQIKYDVYTEDNLVIESESEVKGRLVGKSQNGELLLTINNVHDLHGNEIKVRTSKKGNDYLRLKADQKEIIVYVDHDFWFSY
jgi:hypothetical protein